MSDNTYYYDTQLQTIMPAQRAEIYIDPIESDIFVYDGFYVRSNEESMAFLPGLSRETIEAKGFVYIGEV